MISNEFLFKLFVSFNGTDSGTLDAMATAAAVANVICGGLRVIR